MCNEGALLVLLVLEDKREKLIETLFPKKLDPVCRVRHVTGCDEDRFVFTNTALFSKFTALSPDGLLSKALHVPDVILGLLCCKELSLVSAKALVII
jgi:hypothetical protein